MNVTPKDLREYYLHTGQIFESHDDDALLESHCAAIVRRLYEKFQEFNHWRRLLNNVVLHVYYSATPEWLSVPVGNELGEWVRWKPVKSYMRGERRVWVFEPEIR